MKYDSIIKTGESSTVEFKSTFNQEVVEAVGAFANKRGGIIVVGLKSSDRVMGLQLADESMQKWLNEIKSKTEPVQVPDIEAFKYKGKASGASTSAGTIFPRIPLIFYARTACCEKAS